MPQRMQAIIEVKRVVYKVLSFSAYIGYPVWVLGGFFGK